jgi:hypothetical protein
MLQELIVSKLRNSLPSRSFIRIFTLLQHWSIFEARYTQSIYSRPVELVIECGKICTPASRWLASYCDRQADKPAAKRCKCDISFHMIYTPSRVKIRRSEYGVEVREQRDDGRTWPDATVRQLQLCAPIKILKHFQKQLVRPYSSSMNQHMHQIVDFK